MATMVQKVKSKLVDNSATWWKGVALGIGSLCLYFLVKINDKIDYSYDFNTQQEIKNAEVDEAITKLSIAHGEMYGRFETKLDKLSVDYYQLREDVRSLEAFHINDKASHRKAYKPEAYKINPVIGAEDSARVAYYFIQKP